jgi:hypothetical protein
MNECVGFCVYKVGKDKSNLTRYWESQLSTVFSNSWVLSARVGRRKCRNPQVNHVVEIISVPMRRQPKLSFFAALATPNIASSVPQQLDGC